MSRMVACRVGAVAAVMSVLVSCSGGSSGSGGGVSGSGSPVSSSPSSESPSSEVSSSRPSKSVTPSGPQPSETFTPEQLEAANTVIEFFHILDGVLSDSDAETHALANITTGQTQTIQLKRVSEYREQGRVQTGTVGVHITGASEVRREGDMEVITVQTCTDTTNYDVVESKTGKSVIKPGGRSIYLTWNIDVVKTGEGWKIGDSTNEDALRCPA